MIDPRIPDEAVEAAAKAAYELWCETIRKHETDTFGSEIMDDLYQSWDDFGGEVKADWLDQARAAIAAAINAWPERGMRTIMDADGSYPTVFLPLPAPEGKR